ASRVATTTYCPCVFIWPGALRALPSFPTRRSSDLSLRLIPSRLQRAQGERGEGGLRDRQLRVLIADVHEHPQQLEQMAGSDVARSEEHTSELQSRENLVCRLLLEKKTSARSRTQGT